MSTSNVDLVLLMIIALTSNANSSNIVRVKLEKVLDNATHPKQQAWDTLRFSTPFSISPIMKNSRKLIATSIK
jgi:hypothetical protein